MTTLKSLTMTNVIETSAIPTTVIRSLVRWHGGWSEFKAIANDAANHGANTGISFIDCTDTTAFFRKNAPAIKAWLTDLTDCYDCDSMAVMVKDWGLGAYKVEEINAALYTGKGDAVDSTFQQICFALVEQLANDVVDLVD